jgi:drug/metabolite transporter (DMT)-like permease
MPTADTAARSADPDDRARLPAILLVVGAAVLWSTSGIVFRLIEDADQWQVVFWRSGTLVPFLILLIVLRSGLRPMAMVRAAGWHAPLAGAFLGTAFTCWILALAETTVANAVFILCCSPIASVLLARIFLGERLGRSTGFAIVGVILGVGIITAGAIEGGRLLGNLFALGAALGFASYTVTVRVRRDVDMLPAVFFAGLFSALVGLVATGGDIAIGAYDIWLCTVLGVGQIGLGLVIYTAGARHLPAVELTLLSLIEVVLAPIWVWALLDERPSPETLIGGSVMLAAVGGQAVVMMRRRR